jgi:hypothetical protein
MSDPRETELLQKIEEQDAQIERLERERQLLQERIDYLLRQIYGARSEKMDANQLQLLFQDLQALGPELGKGSSPEGFEIEPPRRSKVSGKSRIRGSRNICRLLRRSSCPRR